MEPTKNIMVCLDLTEMDNILLEYSAFLCRHLPELEKIVIAHNIKFDYPEEAEQILDNLERPLPEVLREAINEKVNQSLKLDREVDLKIIIEADSSTPHLLARLARTWDSNIIVVGKKMAYSGRGITTEKLLRLVNFETALLMVPESVSFQLQKIVVPTDFSDNALAALDMANTFRQRFKADILSLHVMSIPAHYFPYIPVRDINLAMRKDAEKAYAKYIRSALEREVVTDNVPAEFVFSEGNRSSEIIYQEAIKNRANLIVIGARGKGSWASLLGSVTVQLIHTDMYIPLLIVRRKTNKKN